MLAVILGLHKFHCFFKEGCYGLFGIDKDDEKEKFVFPYDKVVFKIGTIMRVLNIGQVKRKP